MNFNEELADTYDIIYGDKDYKSECNFIEDTFNKYSRKGIKTILDAGCGSGNHSILLSDKGYNVVGFDLSEMMIQKAEKKYGKIKNLEFHVMDLRTFQFNSKFDACVCMFAVLGYLTETCDIIKAFKNIRNHLKDDSLFIFDLWNGLAVLRILPSLRTKILNAGKRRIIRIAEPELDAFNHICKVNYRLFIIENNIIVDEVKETHVVRYYFPQELKHYLEESGFEVLKICPFLDLNGGVDENVWNIAIVARAVSGWNEN